MKTSELLIQTLLLNLNGNDFDCECEAWMGVDILLNKSKGKTFYTTIAVFNIDALNSNDVEFKCSGTFELYDFGERPKVEDLMGMTNIATLRMAQRLQATLQLHTNYSKAHAFVSDQPLLETKIHQALDTY